MDLLYNWWTNNIGIIPGYLRFLFYLILLILCYYDYPSPLQADRIYRNTETIFYTPSKIINILKIKTINVYILKKIKFILYISFLFSAIGLLQPYANIISFLSFGILHLVNYGSLGAHHSKHSALFCLFAMCFSVSYDFSMDLLLHNILNYPILNINNTVFNSGFTSSLILIFMSYIMFIGAISKIRYGGLRWMNGYSLSFYIKNSPSRFPLLANYLSNNIVLCKILSCLTIVIEALSPLAIFDTNFRFLIIFLWISLHIGILLVMRPIYIVQIWCYFLIIIPSFDIYRTQFKSITDGNIYSIIILIITTILIISIIKQSEEWPFTCVPMYSNSRIRSKISLLEEKSLLKIKPCKLKKNFIAWPRAWLPCEMIEEIIVTSRVNNKKYSLYQIILKNNVHKFVRWPQYTNVLRKIAIEDYIFKRENHISWSKTIQNAPSTLFLKKLVQICPHKDINWDSYNKIEFICRTNNGIVVISSLSINN